MDYHIEQAQPGHEAILAYIQTESWKSAFQNILEPEILAQFTDFGKVTGMYERTLSENIGNGYLLSAEGAPHCIAWWDATREKDMPHYAELICIHSLPNRWGKGYGSIMMKTVLHDAAAAGYEKIMLWVFAENARAIRFYEKHGFSFNGRVKSGFGATEVCYEKIL